MLGRKVLYVTVVNHVLRTSPIHDKPKSYDRIDCEISFWSTRVRDVLLLLGSSVLITALTVVMTVNFLFDKPVSFVPYFRDGLALSFALNVPLALALQLVETRRGAILATLINAPVVNFLAAYLYGWFFILLIS